jgi:L-ribulokinase
MRKREDYVIGVDFGTSSVRSILVDAHSGHQFATSVFDYPRWSDGKYIDASKNQFRQHPLDYIEGLEYTISSVLSQISLEQRNCVRAISVDTTGSTPVAVNEQGVPLAMLPKFKDNPNAMFYLWKDHTSINEANEINEHSKKFETNYLEYVGGIYSSEWFWAKLLHVLRVDIDVRNECYSWVEHCDWIPFLLSGGTSAKEIKRGVCSAGHKALWSETWNGLPPDEYFSTLDSLLTGFVDKLYDETYTGDKVAGNLCQEWAEKLGLSTDVLIGIGTMDAHTGAVGGQIEPYYLSKVMGTSTCDMLVIPKSEIGNLVVDGICGQVDGSIIPGMIGMEAGQSAFGDIYAWFKDLISWPLSQYLLKSNNVSEEVSKTIKDIESRILFDLGEEAAKLEIDSSSELAVDWHNGRRTPDANQYLKGAIYDLNLGSNAPRIYRSLVEGTCFGAKRIVNRFRDRGVPVHGIIGVGGVAEKSPFIMQMMADILEMPIKIHKSDQTCALGACMFAATVAGIYTTVEDAMENIGQGFIKTYTPDLSKSEIYRIRYNTYLRVCNSIEKNSKINLLIEKIASTEIV